MPNLANVTKLPGIPPEEEIDDLERINRDMAAAYKRGNMPERKVPPTPPSPKTGGVETTPPGTQPQIEGRRDRIKYYTNVDWVPSGMRAGMAAGKYDVTDIRKEPQYVRRPSETQSSSEVFRKSLEEKLGGNPYKIDEYSATDRIVEERMPEWFNNAFRGTHVWPGSPERAANLLDKDRYTFWKTQLNKLKRQVFDRVKADKQRKVEMYKFGMNRFNEKVAEAEKRRTLTKEQRDNLKECYDEKKEIFEEKLELQQKYKEIAVSEGEKKTILQHLYYLDRRLEGINADIARMEGGRPPAGVGQPGPGREAPFVSRETPLGPEEGIGGDQMPTPAPAPTAGPTQFKTSEEETVAYVKHVRDAKTRGLSQKQAIQEWKDQRVKELRGQKEGAKPVVEEEAPLVEEEAAQAPKESTVEPGEFDIETPSAGSGILEDIAKGVLKATKDAPATAVEIAPDIPYDPKLKSYVKKLITDMGKDLKIIFSPDVLEKIEYGLSAGKGSAGELASQVDPNADIKKVLKNINDSVSYIANLQAKDPFYESKIYQWLVDLEKAGVFKSKELETIIAETLTKAGVNINNLLNIVQYGQSAGKQWQAKNKREPTVIRRKIPSRQRAKPVNITQKIPPRPPL